MNTLEDEAGFATLQEEAFFGEAALLTSEPRNSFVRASKGMKLWVLSKDDLEKTFGSFPDVEEVIKRPLAERERTRLAAEEEAGDAQAAAESESAAAGASAPVRVVFEEEGPLGLSLGADSEDGPAQLKDLVQGGVAESFSGLVLGMWLAQVQDLSLIHI